MSTDINQDDSIAVYNALISKFPLKTRKMDLNGDAVAWALKKELHEQRKLYLGQKVDKMDIRYVTKTMYKAYANGGDKLNVITNDIWDTLNMFI